MHELIQNKDLTHFNTFHIKAIAKLFTSISTLEDIQIIYELKNEKLLVLGGGSNILFTDDFDGLVLYNQIKGIKFIKEDDDHVWVKVGGGEQWHSFVEYCIDKGYGGVENLALIPGSVGASPMQNIGAYGVEIKDVVDQIEAYHIKDKAVCFFSAKECEFGYRDSVFKKKWKDQFIILNVTFQLSKKPVFNISYGAIKKELESKGIHDLSLRSIADAVIAIRSSKLPDPAKIGNAGSFFKNPIITSSQFSTLQNMYPDIVGYEESHSSKIKVAAGWLIEHAGWKGFRKGDAGVNEKQALVLVNHGNASGKDILDLSKQIIFSIQEKYNIHLEREVNII